MVSLLLECLVLLVTLLSDSCPSLGFWDTGLAGVDTTVASIVEQIAKVHIRSLPSCDRPCVAAPETILGHSLG